jgi:hypothetical protein
LNKKDLKSFQADYLSHVVQLPQSHQIHRQFHLHLQFLQRQNKLAQVLLVFGLYYQVYLQFLLCLQFLRFQLPLHFRQHHLGKYFQDLKTVALRFQDFLWFLRFLHFPKLRYQMR